MKKICKGCGDEIVNDQTTDGATACYSCCILAKDDYDSEVLKDE